MDKPYSTHYQIRSSEADCFGRLTLNHLLEFMQESAGQNCEQEGWGRSELMKRGLFWAVIRQKVSITRLPSAMETIRVDTWPMPVTRTAFPRATMAYDERGNELFRAIGLWIVMDYENRKMVLPAKCGLDVPGLLTGLEMTPPGSIVPRELANQELRQVRYSELDWNGHMNNCRYLDWVTDVLPAEFQRAHQPKSFTVAYASEAREGERLAVDWELSTQGELSVEIRRQEEIPGKGRVFGARLQY
ncbi:MAG: thioesterase [Firmicutes bacterium]|nr:thioesterase [Bacillota bacterium]